MSRSRVVRVLWPGTDHRGVERVLGQATARVAAGKDAVGTACSRQKHADRGVSTGRARRAQKRMAGQRARLRVSASAHQVRKTSARG